MKIKTISRKTAPSGKYEIRKERITHDDGKIEDRVVCYTPEGYFLGGIRDAEAKMAEQKKPQTKGHRYERKPDRFEK